MAEGRRDTRIYWLLLRIVGITSAVLFVALGGYGMAVDLTESQDAARAETQQFLGWLALIWAGGSQSCEAILNWRTP